MVKFIQVNPIMLDIDYRLILIIKEYIAISIYIQDLKNMDQIYSNFIFYINRINLIGIY